MIHFTTQLTDSQRMRYIRSLLTENDWNHLLHLSNEWKDFDYYDSQEEMIEDNFEIIEQYKGYDVLYEKLVYIVEYRFKLPEYYNYLRKVIEFDTFDNYYNFFGGKIDDGCYYLYEWEEKDLKQYNIDVENVKLNWNDIKTIDNERTIEQVTTFNKLHWDLGESRRNEILSLAKVFFNYDSYESMQKDYPELNYGIFCATAQFCLNKDPDKVFEILESVKSFVSDDLRNFILLHYRDGKRYDRFSKKYTLDLFPKINDKSYITADTPIYIRNQFGFDKDLHMFYKEYLFRFSLNDWDLSYKQLFENIDDLALECNNDFSNSNFSNCFYNIEWSKYKTTNALIPIGNISVSVKIKLVKHAYDITVVYKQGNVEVSSSRTTLTNTRDFIRYMKYDIDDSGMHDVIKQLKINQSVVVNWQ